MKFMEDFAPTGLSSSKANSASDLKTEIVAMATEVENSDGKGIVNFNDAVSTHLTKPELETTKAYQKEIVVAFRSPLVQSE